MDIAYTLNDVTVKVRSCAFLIKDDMLLLHKKNMMISMLWLAEM